MRSTRIISLIAALILGLGATAASADEPMGYYVGAYYFDWDTEVDSPVFDDFDTSDLPEIGDSGYRLVGGYMFNDYIGAELHLADGGTDDLGEGVELDLEQVVGVFARFGLPTRWVNVFGLIGVSHTKITGSVEGAGSDSASDESISIGAGLEVAIIPETLHVGADYIEYYNETGKDGLSGVQISAASVGLKYSF